MAKLKNAHALLIGVGGKDIPETINDAKAINEILANKETGSYYKSNVKILTGKKASRKGILKAFDDLLERTDEDSSVLLFYSGHGGMYSDNTFIKDETKRNPKQKIKSIFISARLIINQKNTKPLGLKPKK